MRLKVLFGIKRYYLGEKLTKYDHYNCVGDKTSQIVDATKDVAAAGKYKMEFDIQKVSHLLI